MLTYNNRSFQVSKVNNSIDLESQKPWYFKGGTRRPVPARINRKTGKKLAKLWPHDDWTDDRILSQLMYVPPAKKEKPEKLKKILVYFGLASWYAKPGRDVFIRSKCPVDTCTLTASQSEAATADAILFKDRFVHPGHVRHSRQVRYKDKDTNANNLSVIHEWECNVGNV